VKANPNKDGIETVLTDCSVEIAFSDLRRSLFKNPLIEDAGLNQTIAGYDATPEVGGIREDRCQNCWESRSDVYQAQEHLTFLISVDADGFFDRRPIRRGSA
jgi:hypothetical protein